MLKKKVVSEYSDIGAAELGHHSCPSRSALMRAAFRSYPIAPQMMDRARLVYGAHKILDPLVEGSKELVVGLIRTNFLKRFKSSATVFEMSVFKHLGASQRPPI